MSPTFFAVSSQVISAAKFGRGIFPRAASLSGVFANARSCPTVPEKETAQKNGRLVCGSQFDLFFLRRKTLQKIQARS